MALEQAADNFEAEAKRRAIDGMVRFKFKRNGEPLLDPRTNQPYYELDYSDTLLIFMLKGMRPQKYRENHRLEHAGDQSAPIQHNHAVQLTLEEFRQLPTAEKLKHLRDMAAKSS